MELSVIKLNNKSTDQHAFLDVEALNTFSAQEEASISSATQRKFFAEAPRSALPAEFKIYEDLKNLDKGVSGALQVLKEDLRKLGADLNSFLTSQGFSLGDLCGGFATNGVPLPNALTLLLNNGFTFSSLDLSPRAQWTQDKGYCGETCLISNALAHGEYISQAEARRLCGGEMLLGEHSAAELAKALHLNTEIWDKPQSTSQFLSWVESQLALGHPVVVGLYMNTSLFGRANSVGENDPSYDHICTITNIKDGSITFSDNGLYTPAGPTPYTYTIPLSQFVNNRAAANSPLAPPYSLPEFSAGDEYNNEGLAITGFNGPLGSLPVRLLTNINSEPYASHCPLKLTGCVSGLKAGKIYAIKIYNHLDGKEAETITFTATGSHYVFPITEINGQPIRTSDEIMVQVILA